MAKMYGLIFGVALSVACLLQVNEASSSSMEMFASGSQRFKETLLQTTKAELKAEVEASSSAMSVEHAMLVLRTSNHTSAQLLGFLQENVGQKTRAHLKGGNKQQQVELESPGADVQADYGSGLKNALVRLNEMMLETIMNMDAEDLECKQAKRTQSYYIEELQQDLEYYQRMNTEGNARVLDARGQKGSYGDKIPVVKGELVDHNYQCVHELADLNRQLIVAKNDFKVMDKILNMTACSDEAYDKADAKVVLLQCVNKRTGKRYRKMQATDAQLKKELAKLQHPKSLDAMRNAIVTKPRRVAFVQQARRLRNGKVGGGPPSGLPSGGDGGFEYGVTILNASNDENLEAGADECSSADIGTTSFCPELRERFLNIAGGVSDAIEDLEMMIENKQSRCQQIRADLTAEMEHYEYWHAVWETRHAAATAELGESRTQFKNKVKELGNARTLYSEKTEACIKNLEDAKSELCALHKIRGELSTMSAWDKEITDCDVSEWEVPACPVTCGGGTQHLTRIVEMLPGAGDEVWSKGHECPLLGAQQSCNEFRCPVDCELEDWEEWSRCTVTCGGGVRERLRAIVVHPTPLGNPCELTLETILCNSGPCDRDCEMSDWTEWSNTCSKMCGGGVSTRVKTLVTAELGAGTCDKFYTPTRFQERPCNVQPCQYLNRVGTCSAKVDVMLVIDGSGSLGADGFEVIRETGVKLASAVRGDSTLGAMIFSSAWSTCSRIACLGGTWKKELLAWFECASGWFDWEPTPYQCGIDWISHLTADKTYVIEELKKATWPAGGTLTSKALKSAQVEMVNSRKGAPSVVIVLTDGFPYSPWHTEQNAMALKESGARLMMVPIGSDVADTTHFELLVSHPPKDNLLHAGSFEDLTESNVTVNTILTDFCMKYKP